ncbi:MAG: cyclic nucleotide-binding domain-containing protein, partial [Planctomycetaceae bacterium]
MNNSPGSASPDTTAMLNPDSVSTLHQSLSSLFGNDSSAQLSLLCQSARLRSLTVGEILMSEWESATEVFVLLAGRCGFYTQDAEQRLRLMETVDKPGEQIGAQAFLEGRQFRSASVIALDQTSVAVLPGQQFRQLLSASPAAADQLQSRTIRYALNKLGVLAEELAQQADLQRAPQGAVRQFPAGTTLYQAGQSADTAWFLLAGEIALTQADSTQPSETIRAGLLFGQSDVLAGCPRREHATAVTAVEVLSIDAQVLRSCQQQGGRLGTILTALTSAHQLPQLGTVYRYMAQVEQQPCIVSDYTQPSGSRIRVRYFPQLPLLEATRQEPATGTITLASPDRSRLLILTSGGCLTGLTVRGAWQQLPLA